MNVYELIQILEGMDQEAEVRLAIQPSWPFEHGIGEVIEGPEPDECQNCGGPIHTADPDLDSDEEHDPECEGGEWPKIVYIGEAGQIGYLPGEVSRELGWR